MGSCAGVAAGVTAPGTTSRRDPAQISGLCAVPIAGSCCSDPSLAFPKIQPGMKTGGEGPELAKMICCAGFVPAFLGLRIAGLHGLRGEQGSGGYWWQCHVSPKHEALQGYLHPSVIYERSKRFIPCPLLSSSRAVTLVLCCNPRALLCPSALRTIPTPQANPSPAGASSSPFTRCWSQHEHSWWAKTLQEESRITTAVPARGFRGGRQEMPPEGGRAPGGRQHPRVRCERAVSAAAGRGQPSEARLAGLFPTSPVIKRQPLMHGEKEGEKEKRISKPKPLDYCLPPRGAQKYIVHLIDK